MQKTEKTQGEQKHSRFEGVLSGEQDSLPRGCSREEETNEELCSK